MTTGHSSFDHAAPDANIWLNAVADQLHFEDRRRAYSALRAALHALRDRLTPEACVHLGAQFPTMIRGLYYEGWRLAGKPLPSRDVDEFCEHIARELPPGYPMDPKTLAKGVFNVLFQRLDPGEVAKVIAQLPVPLRSLWPQAGQ